MKHLIPAFLAFLTLQAGAQNVKLNSGGDWKVPVKDGVLELKGRMRKITSEQLQKVDPAARYTLSMIRTDRKSSPIMSTIPPDRKPY